MRTGTTVPIERGGRPNYDDHTISISHRIQEIETTGTQTAISVADGGRETADVNQRIRMVAPTGFEPVFEP